MLPHGSPLAYTPVAVISQVKMIGRCHHLPTQAQSRTHTRPYTHDNSPNVVEATG